MEAKKLTRPEKIVTIVTLVIILTVCSGLWWGIHQIVTAQEEKRGIWADPTPVPTPTLDQQLKPILWHDLHKPTWTWDSPTSLTVTVNATRYFSGIDGDILIEDDAGHAFRDVFTTAHRLDTMTIRWMGQTLDAYGNATPTLRATATLSSATARKIHWDALGYGMTGLDQMWHDYDTAQLFDTPAP